MLLGNRFAGSSHDGGYPCYLRIERRTLWRCRFGAGSHTDTPFCLCAKIQIDTPECSGKSPPRGEAGNPVGGVKDGYRKRPSRSTPQCARRKARPKRSGKATKGGVKLMLPIFSLAPAWGSGLAPRQRALERADDCTAKHRVCASRGVEIMTCSRPLIRTRPAVAGLRPVCDQRHRILFSPVPADCSVV